MNGTWMPVGGKAEDSSQVNFDDVNIEVSVGGTPYVFSHFNGFTPGSSGVKFNGTGWQNVGGAYYDAIFDAKLDKNSTSYVAFADNVHAPGPAGILTCSGFCSQTYTTQFSMIFAGLEVDSSSQTYIVYEYATSCIPGNNCPLQINNTAVTDFAGNKFYGYGDCKLALDRSATSSYGTLYCAFGDSSDGKMTVISIDSKTVGIDQPVKNISFRVFPNPSRDKFYIEAEEEIGMLEVFNLLGEPVLSVKLDAGKHELDLSKQQPGVYFLHAGTTCIKLIID